MRLLSKLNTVSTPLFTATIAKTRLGFVSRLNWWESPLIRPSRFLSRWGDDWANLRSLQDPVDLRTLKHSSHCRTQRLTRLSAHNSRCCPVSTSISSKRCPSPEFPPLLPFYLVNTLRCVACSRIRKNSPRYLAGKAILRYIATHHEHLE